MIHWRVNNFECLVQKNSHEWKAAISCLVALEREKNAIWCHYEVLLTFLNPTFCKWAPLESIHSQKGRQTLFETSSGSCLNIPLITASIRVSRFTKSSVRLSNTLLFTYPHKKIRGSYIGAPGWLYQSRLMRDYKLTKFVFQDLQNCIRAMWGCPILLEPCLLHYNTLLTQLRKKKFFNMFTQHSTFTITVQPSLSSNKMV